MRHQLFVDVDTPVDVPTSGIVKVAYNVPTFHVCEVG